MRQTGDDMKFELETIPVWDAFHAEVDCPLCYQEERLERQYVEFYLGTSVMAPEVRMEVNRSGFCRRHFSMLLEGGNRLGLALMTETHLGTSGAELEEELERLARAVRPRFLGIPLPRSLVPAGRSRVRECAEVIAARERECLVCRRMEQTLGNYMYTISVLFRRNEEFRSLFDSSPGVCYRHLARMVAIAGDTLPAQEYVTFLRSLRAVMERRRRELQTGLNDFTERFDFRSRGPIPEKVSRYVAEAVQRVTGRF